MSSLYHLYLHQTPEENWSSHRYRTAGVSSTAVGQNRFRSSSQEQPLREDFLANEYWSRAWITQEIFLAQSVNLIFENEVLSFDCLQNQVETRTNSGPSPELIRFRDMLNSLRPYSQSYDSNRLGRGSQFAHTLHGLGAKQCSIPRNRIFFILPHYKWSDRIRVDYGSTDADLAIAIRNSLHESLTFCSSTTVAQSLLPQVCAPGTGFIYLDFDISGLHWGLLRISGIFSYDEQTMNGNRSKASP